MRSMQRKKEESQKIRAEQKQIPVYQDAQIPSSSPYERIQIQPISSSPSNNSKQRPQKPSLLLRINNQDHINNKDEANCDEQVLNYWHYKQTGIKSRPIKLLRHPIEHIERKIIITYLLAFLFKLIAVFTGPLIVLVVYLITVPFVILQRSTWFLLNLQCTFDARIKTLNPSINELCDQQQEGALLKNKEPKTKLERQIFWNYCPLGCTETYWFKEKLVNTVILVVDNRENDFSLIKFRQLVREKILIKPAFRKFLSSVVARGLPFYKGYYWRYLGLSDVDHECDSDSNSSEENQSETTSEPTHKSSTNTLYTSIDQFSLTSIATKTSHDYVKIPLPNDIEENSNYQPIYLSRHIFIDRCLQESEKNRATIRLHAYNLLEVHMDIKRPLWELRVIPSTSNKKTYIIFRCHQCLADGQSLSMILTDFLTVPNVKIEPQLTQTDATNESHPSNTPESKLEKHLNELEEEEEEEDTQLEPIKKKRSFISKISKSNSLRSAIFVGPLTVIFWIIWTFTRRKNNHLNKCSERIMKKTDLALADTINDSRRFYMTHYDLTKFYQIKQMTRSTVSDVILCALSGALREYLRKFNGVSNPPNINASLVVDMRQSEPEKQSKRNHSSSSSPPSSVAKCDRLIVMSAQESTERSTRSKELIDFEGAPQVNCTLVNVPLPTSIEGIVPRLWDTRNTMDALRTSADPWVMLGLQQILFTLLPVPWYQWLINYIALRNSSTFVSNIQGPSNMVESWCVDLLKRTIFEAQLSARAQLSNCVHIFDRETPKKSALVEAQRLAISKQHKASQLKFINEMGSISAVYYCMQPPTSDIPISFNCITYHNKLFVTSLSRSLLVEDSKLLIRLFFKQLNQIASTIAKRKSLITIIRAPIEVSCKPPSPVPDDIIFNQSETDPETTTTSCVDRDEDFEEKQPARSVQQPLKLLGKDDLGVGYETNGRKSVCGECQQLVCSCRRRKSLVSYDHNKQRSNNLASLLHPINFKTDENQVDHQNASECHCGQRFLEELDEEEGASKVVNESEVLSAKSRSPSDDGCRLKRSPNSCVKCWMASHRSTLSLNSSATENHKRGQGIEQWSDSVPIGAKSQSEINTQHSNASIDSNKGILTSTNLDVPNDHDKLNVKIHSKSETDLMPSKTGVNQREGLKDSWLMISRKKTRKFSLFSRSNQSNQRQMSSKHSYVFNDTNCNSNMSSRCRNSIETPTETIFNNSQDSSRRRQSIATSLDTSHRSTMVKDEINADINLRYQLEGQLLGIRSRRFSTIGSAVVGTQRRGSLIPFGLMHNNSLPKLFWNDSETHL